MIARRTEEASATGSPVVRTASVLPNEACRNGRYIVGSADSRVGSLRTLPTTPMTVIHGAFGFGGPMWICAPTASPFGQYRRAIASLITMTGGESERSVVAKTRPCLIGMRNVRKYSSDPAPVRMKGTGSFGAQGVSWMNRPLLLAIVVGSCETTVALVTPGKARTRWSTSSYSRL